MIRQLGRYELLEQVGSGGMAIVYRGRDTVLDREVAVKVLHPHLASAPESRARFSREARAVARLAHPGIVEIYDYSGDAAAESYLVTEFVQGRTLRLFAHEVRFGHPEIALLVGRALADALVHAHSAGVIHRDLKPENVLVKEGEAPAVKLADFGIARILATDERLTMTGALVGSPHHMAPEIIEGRDADARSDIFSLGTILYWLATGKLPFAAPNPTAILHRVLDGDFEDPRSADERVSDPLARIVASCLSVDPARRPSSAADVRTALDGVLAQVGLESPVDELRAFLRDAAAFKEAFPARAVASLIRLGDDALAEGSSARALAAYSRVLTIDPENAAVPAKLARLSRRRRLRRALAWSAAASVAALVGSTAVAVLGPHRAAPPAQPQPVSHPAVAPLAHRATFPMPTAPAPPRQSPRPAAAPARPSPPPVPLVVHVRPYAQRALLDGVEVAHEEQLVRFAVAPGKAHVMSLEHPCCKTFVRTITAEEASRAVELRIPLEPKPAHLRVDGAAATRVFVEGKLLGTAGDSQRAPFSVAVPAGGSTPYEGTAVVAFELGNAPPREVQVSLKAGGDVVVAGPTAEAER